MYLQECEPDVTTDVSAEAFTLYRVCNPGSRSVPPPLSANCVGGRSAPVHVASRSVSYQARHLSTVFVLRDKFCWENELMHLGEVGNWFCAGRCRLHLATRRRLATAAILILTAENTLCNS